MRCGNRLPTCNIRHHPPEGFAFLKTIEAMRMGAFFARRTSLIGTPGLTPFTAVRTIRIVIPYRIIAFDVCKIEKNFIVRSAI